MAPRARLVTAASPHRLEQALLEEVRAALRSGDAPRVAVVVPTTFLATHLRRRLAAVAGPAGVVAGIDVLHHRRLAQDVLEHAYLLGRCAQPPPRILSDTELHVLVLRTLEELPADDPLRRFVVLRPRALASLARTLTELREACATPDDLRHVARAGVVATLHAAHARRLEEVEASLGVTDQPGHARRAAAAARALGARIPWRRVIHHGAYELVGAQADLLDAIAGTVPTCVLAPCGRGPAFAHAERSLRRWLGDATWNERSQLDAEADAGLLDLGALFDESAPVRLPRSGAVQTSHARGAVMEVDAAVRLATAAVLDRGCAPEDVAILGRSLQPFEHRLEDTCRTHGVPYTASVGAPLAREPWAHAALGLLEVLTDDLPRRATCELLASPMLRLDGHLPAGVAPTPDLWDAWTRAAGVVRSAASLRDDTLAWHEADLGEREVRSGEPVARGASWVVERRRRLEALGAVASALEAEARTWSACREAGDHAAFLRGLASRWLLEPDARAPADASAAAAHAALVEALEDLRRSGALWPGRQLDPPAVRALLADGLHVLSVREGRTDGTGLRVLDVMQARGVPFREVVLVGFNQGLVPRRPRLDPFLPEDVRAALRERGRAIALRAEGRDEERLLLALMLGAASERVTVTWQRADDTGRARAPSLFLREVARLALGAPDLWALTRRADGDDRRAEALPHFAVPAHPSEAARWWRETTSRATWRDAVLEVADRPRRRVALRRLLAARPPEDVALLASLDKLELVDAHPDSKRAERAAVHDGVVGPGVLAARAGLSATALATLGRCPLQWLLGHGLRVEELREPEDEEHVEARDVGSAVHRTLEAVYRDALARGGTPEAVAAPATRTCLEAAWDRELRALAGARLLRAPVLYAGFGARWLEALRRFVAEDGSRLQRLDARVVDVELSVEGDVDVPGAAGRRTIRLHGRFDRLLESPEGWRVEDYKTARKVGQHVVARDVLKGTQLQGLAYRLLAEACAARWTHRRLAPGDPPQIDVAFLPVHPDAEEVPAELELDEALMDGARETVGVLTALVDGGLFPMQPDGPCRYCPHEVGCRRRHPFALERLLRHPDLRDHRDLEGKVKKRPTLRSVREAGPAAAGDE